MLKIYNDITLKGKGKEKGKEGGTAYEKTREKCYLSKIIGWVDQANPKSFPFPLRKISSEILTWNYVIGRF